MSACSVCIYISNHHVVLKFLTILFLNYMSVKLKFEKKKNVNVETLEVIHCGVCSNIIITAHCSYHIRKN